ncbi:MAG: signal peptidase I [Candidatus Levybacteria bacterium CG_4_9_14_3_um_filter_35_16]|nr:MAG: signal peptidase I [Candidatus Levybacteria bacterium CG_4_10_14_0_2_um_filter_35_8]PJA90914.1 MAG: signal peptidase I [Candidatus Levybacteria bacterium CG_4_9_14_3_um_filter_35_16]PJC54586.1 MAG: signal peptidase I [Candidatus Levybacteria bacterium CG_4_9_14_0_2_um_filter_35_21]
MIILRKIYSFLIDSVQTFLMAAAVFLVIYIFLFRPFEVKGESMFPNFLNKEYVLTNLISLRFSDPKLGEVIVFKSPTDPEKDYIKRIIGSPGDTVEVRNGEIYVNNKLLDESPYLNSSVKTFGGAFLKESVPVTVPEGKYFVMGDNRLYSSDSREWGFVTKEAVIGRSWLVYWPLSDVKIIKNPFK